MGALAEMSAGDRAIARDCARVVCEGVVDDDRTVMHSLRWFETARDVPMETLVLWLAQLVVEAHQMPRDDDERAGRFSKESM